MNRRNFLTGAAALGVGALALRQVPGLIHPNAVHADQKLTTVPVEVHRAGCADAVCEGDDVQQFLRVWDGQVGSGEECAHAAHAAVDGAGDGHGEEAADDRYRHDLMKYRPLESRVYRHRCVEAWSMVIPWDGLLAERVHQLAMEPLPSAKYVQFISDSDKTAICRTSRAASTGPIPRGCGWMRR